MFLTVQLFFFSHSTAKLSLTSERLYLKYATCLVLNKIKEGLGFILSASQEKMKQLGGRE